MQQEEQDRDSRWLTTGNKANEGPPRKAKGSLINRGSFGLFHCRPRTPTRAASRSCSSAIALAAANAQRRHPLQLPPSFAAHASFNAQLTGHAARYHTKTPTLAYAPTVGRHIVNRPALAAAIRFVMARCSACALVRRPSPCLWSPDRRAIMPFLLQHLVLVP